MEKLIHFLKEHHVLCLATGGPEGPHACPLYYAVVEEPLELIFLSDPKTRHMEAIAAGGMISAGVYLETEEIGLIQGAQLWGRAETLKDGKEAAKTYFKRFPHARIFHLANPGHVFCKISVERARLIDNRLGFGNKKEWDLQSS